MGQGSCNVFQFHADGACYSGVHPPGVYQYERPTRLALTWHCGMLTQTQTLKVGGRHHKLVGASLVEVLLSILVASVALLALARVNVMSIRYTKMSQYRGTSTQLVSDMAERMRANKAGLASYSLQTSFAAQATLPGPAPTLCHSVRLTLSPPTYSNPYAVTCDASQMAADDVQTWQVLVRAQLPEGSVVIVPQSEQAAADVWVAWRDPAVTADDLAANASECPGDLGVGTDPSVRCSYFRIHL